MTGFWWRARACAARRWPDPGRRSAPGVRAGRAAAPAARAGVRGEPSAGGARRANARARTAAAAAAVDPPAERGVPTRTMLRPRRSYSFACTPLLLSIQHLTKRLRQQQKDAVWVAGSTYRVPASAK
jgi:hypothetical protein